MVSIRDEFGAFREGLDDVTEGSQTDVDGIGLFLSLLIYSSFG